MDNDLQTFSKVPFQANWRCVNDTQKKQMEQKNRNTCLCGPKIKLALNHSYRSDVCGCDISVGRGFVFILQL